MKPKAVFLVDSPWAGPTSFFEIYNDVAMGRLRALFDIEPVITPIEAAAEAEYVFSTWGMHSLGEEQIRASLPRVKAVFYAAGTVQYFARPFLKRGVKIFSAWAANAVSVAEFTVAQILLANRGYFHDIRRAQRPSEKIERPGSYHSKVGILGAGMIGRRVIETLEATTDLDILVYDPFVRPEYLAAHRAQGADLGRIFRECSVITNHVANLPATVGMLDYTLFSQMGPHATFINTGRGAQVVEADLIRALKEAPGRTALLDVTDPEPPLPESELRTLPNVFLSPHIAGTLASEYLRMALCVIEEAEALLAGRPTRYEVTEKMLETMA